MDRIITYKIKENENNTQILDFLRLKGFSRNILSSMKSYKEAILLNGEKAGGRTLLSEGDCLTIHVPETGDAENIPPVSIPLSILYEDEDLLVVNKPAGMPVHPSMGNYYNTLANGAAFYFQKQGIFCPFRCINRLGPRYLRRFDPCQKPLKRGAPLYPNEKKRNPPHLPCGSKGDSSFSWKNLRPYCQKRRFCNTRCVDFEQGESAVTYYERLDSHKGLSLLKLRLETGRTHQIRVHMGYLGFPLPGDYLYCPDYTCFQRQPLHSFQLEFSHPITNKELVFLAPVPEDMVKGFL